MNQDNDVNVHTFLPLFFQAVIYIFTIVLFKIFCNFRVSGLANFDEVKGKSIIFASNHTSEWDGILIRIALSFFSTYSPIYYVSLEKRHYNFSGIKSFLYGGTVFKWVGAYPAFRGAPSYEDALRTHIKILKKGGAVCIFPEGKRNFNHEIGYQAHGGITCLAIRTNTLVIPVLIKNVKLMTLKDILLRRRKVSVTFGKAINLTEIISNSNPTPEESRIGAKYVMERIKELDIIT